MLNLISHTPMWKPDRLSPMKPKSKNRPPKNGGLFSIMGYRTYRTICVFLMPMELVCIELHWRDNKGLFLWNHDNVIYDLTIYDVLLKLL